MQEVGHVVVTAKHGNIKKYLLSDYLPKLGIREKLEEGIDVLDVGCGVGMQVLELGTLKNCNLVIREQVRTSPT